MNEGRSSPRFQHRRQKRKMIPYDTECLPPPHVKQTTAEKSPPQNLSFFTPVHVAARSHSNTSQTRPHHSHQKSSRTLNPNVVSHPPQNSGTINITRSTLKVNTRKPGRTHAAKLCIACSNAADSHPTRKTTIINPRSNARPGTTSHHPPPPHGNHKKNN